MNNFFDRMRSGAGKAAFEADKLRRVTLIQNELRGLRDDYQKAIAQAGQVAFSLYQRGQITQPELRVTCDAAAAVLARISAQEADIERIRGEQFVESAPGDAYDPAGLICPVGHGPLPVGARFCATCGQPGLAPAAPPARRCPTCGDGLAADARFCANCGQAIALPDSRAPAPPLPDTMQLGPAASAPPAATCPSCRAPLSHPDAPFCDACGQTFGRDA